MTDFDPAADEKPPCPEPDTAKLAQQLTSEANQPVEPKVTPPKNLSDIPAEVLMGRLLCLYSVTNIQCQKGNWNYDPYMQGLANGLLLAVATMTDSDYKPLSAPEEWLADRPKFTPEICPSSIG